MLNLIDYYVCNTVHSTKTKSIIESDIPTSSGSLNIVEVKYDDLFGPLETVRLSEILVSLVAQQQHAKVFGSILSEGTSLNISTSLVEREGLVPFEVTTAEVPIHKDNPPVPYRRPIT